MHEFRLDNYYAALKLIEILLKMGKINQATYANLLRHQDLHISQAA